MKKRIVAVCAVAVLLFIGYEAHYRLGFYISLGQERPVTALAYTDGTDIYLEQGGGPVLFEIRGVNIGTTIPGARESDHAIDRETYLRWFGQIQAMGSNTIRVYTILPQDFYDAFYEYNTQREEAGEEPLYLLHGVRVDEYELNSRRDAFELRQTFIEDCRALVDVLHGQRTLSALWREDGVGGSYRRDVSRWVVGYILGVEWEADTVACTDDKYQDMVPYQGTYFSASDDATPFESMLAQVGDELVAYESERYGQQRLVSFVNWPSTDPFLYPESISAYFRKCALVDVERIYATERLISGQFASYHVYPYYPDYINYMLDPVEGLEVRWQTGSVWADKSFFHKLYEKVGVSCEELLSETLDVDRYDADSSVNTYYEYLKLLTRHHTMPVVIAEFGVSSGRGMSQIDWNTGRNDGNLTEREQGQALVECWRDIKTAGCAGGCVAWQDDWSGQSGNTVHAVDLNSAPYWGDRQTSGQYFGVLAFQSDLGASAVVDGDESEWTEQDLVCVNDGMELFMRYDAEYLYFLVHKEGFAENGDALYIPIDTNPKVGSFYCENYNVSFARDADFVIVINGRDDSRVLVQARYEVLRAMFSHELNLGYDDAYLDPPARDTSEFKEIDLLLQTAVPLFTGSWRHPLQTYETGKLRYGNADPAAPDFDSLADFTFAGDYVEIRVPWQLLNFSDPSHMMIHDDYYEHYGVEDLHIDVMYAGIGSAGSTGGAIPMADLPLEGWGRTVPVCERLKESYYILQDCWTSPLYLYN